MLIRVFTTLLRHFRDYGHKLETGQYRALLLGITAIYGAAALVIFSAAAKKSVQRAWERAIAEPPRRRPT